MTKEEMEEHANKYSQSYGYDKRNGNKMSPWSTNFDAMATKTVLKLLISKYGIMSIDTESSNLARAIQADGGTIDADGNIEYVDNKTIDIVAEEVEQNTGKERQRIDLTYRNGIRFYNFVPAGSDLSRDEVLEPVVVRPYE